MYTILVPTDFSKAAQIATDVAVDIAIKAKAKLILLHIIEKPYAESFSVQGEVSHSNDWDEKLYTMKLVETSRLKISESIEAIKQKGVSATHELRLGNPFHGMSEMFNNSRIDLVVMGTLGHSKLKEMIVGSNTEKVVRHSKCPVLTVHEAPAKKEFKNIVYATSLISDELKFSRIVSDMQKLYDATIHVVRINTPGNFQNDTVVKNVMNAFAEKAKLNNFTLNIFNDYTEEAGILNFAETINADLIAMSTHGRTGFAHVIAGSIAEDVANHSQRPVLTSVIKSE